MGRAKHGYADLSAADYEFFHWLLLLCHEHCAVTNGTYGTFDQFAAPLWTHYERFCESPRTRVSRYYLRQAVSAVRKALPPELGPDLAALLDRLDSLAREGPV